MGAFSQAITRVGAVFLAVMALTATPARADSFPAWMKETTDKGCFIYEYGEAIAGMDTDPNSDGFLWTGPCTPGQPINGQGTLYKQTNYPMEDGTHLTRIMGFTGQVQNGLFVGPVSYAAYDVDRAGKWNPAAGHTDDGWGPGEDYVQGCRKSDIASGQLAEYGCQPGKMDDPIPIFRVKKPYFPLPAGFVGSGSGDGSSYAGGTTFTTVGGAAVAPPTFAAPQEKALGTVTDGLVSTLGGRSGIGFSSGDVTVDAIIASLRTTLGLNGNAALGGKAGQLNPVLAEVRKALGGANPASTNGQIADLVMDTVRLAIAKTPGAKAAGGKAPGGKASGAKASGTKASGGATGAPALASYAAPPPPAAKTASGAKTGGAKLVSAAKIQSVIDYFASKGVTVTRGTDASGKPKLTEAANLYQVLFYDCSATNDQCQTLQFNACYDHYAKANVTKTNEWSAGYVKIKAYIDSNGWVCLDQAVPTGLGGISYEAMDLSYDAFIWFTQNADGQFK
jgi:hypothetical protein